MAAKKTSVKAKKSKKPSAVKKSKPIKKVIKKASNNSKKVNPATKKITATKVKLKKAAKKSSVKPILKVKSKPKVFKEIALVVPNQEEKRIRKSSKKNIIALPPPPKIEVSSHPKTKVKNILISQPKPVETEKNPYFDLAKKYGLNLTFKKFINIEGLSAQEFRLQRIDITAHGAVIMTSKLAVDHYFRMCNEMRITVPETMKYFCINEQTAYYLQKYIQYRKRKIFFGHGTILDLVDVIKKNKNEKFLIPVSDVHKEQIVDFLDDMNITYSKGTFYKTICADLSSIKSLDEFDIVVLFTPVGIKSLKQNFKNVKQGNIRIAAFGHATAQMVKEEGYRLDIFAPNPQNPSMSSALETYIKEANKR